jgi:hypothetical protein
LGLSTFECTSAGCRNYVKPEEEPITFVKADWYRDTDPPHRSIYQYAIYKTQPRKFDPSEWSFDAYSGEYSHPDGARLTYPEWMDAINRMLP